MIMLPGATPKDIVARLHRELMKALQASDVLVRLKNEGADVVGNTPDEAAAIVRRDFDKWADVIRRTGIRAE